MSLKRQRRATADSRRDRVFRRYNDTATYKAIFAGGAAAETGPAYSTECCSDLQGAAPIVLPRP